MPQSELKFIVNHSCVDSYINKYFKDKAELLFLTETLTDGKISYETYEGELDYTGRKKDKKEDFKSFLTTKIASFLEINKDEFKHPLEELTFLIAFIGRLKQHYSHNAVQNNIYHEKVINLIDTAILIKKHGLASVNLKALVIIDSKKKKHQSYLPSVKISNLDEGYISTSHFIKNLAVLLGVSLDNSLNMLLQDNITIDNLFQLKQKFPESQYIVQKTVEARGAIMLRDYLSDWFDIKNDNAKLISSNQIRIIYDVYYRLGWQIVPDIQKKYIDRFLKEVEDNWNRVSPL